jgi:outer membrane protein W
MKNYITLLFILLTLSIGAQEENELKSWRMKAASSFAPGFLTENTKTIQLQVTLGFIKDKIELRGDASYFLNSFGDRPRFSMNHQIFAGAFYRFSEKKFQPYIGFQPGIAMSQSSEFGSLNATTQELEYKVSYNPLGSLAAGIDFFGKKWFYLFTEARYIFGKHKSNTYPVYLDEFRLSFGLGFTF